MTAKTAERQQRKHQKKRRQTLINTLNKLEIENCHSCPNRNFLATVTDPNRICGGCPTFEKLRSVGDELDRVANIVKTYKLPDELNMSTYIKLRELNWDKADICKHYDLRKWELVVFLNLYKGKTARGEIV